MADDLKDLKPVYLIHGSEELRLDRAVRRLKERLGRVADLDFNLQVFDGETADADEVVSAANTLPFMSERRLVVVRNVERMAAGGLEALAAYAADPAEYTTLVLVATKVDRRWRLFKTVQAAGGAAEYAAPKRHEYPRWVADMFKERGKTVDPDAAELLVEAVGRDLRKLSVEVDKIASYAGEKDRLRAEDMAEIVTATAPASVFDFTDRLGERDCAGALRSLARLLDGGEDVLGVHAMSLWHLRRLIGAQAMRARGVGGAEAGKAIGAAEWQVRKLLAQAERFAPGELTAALTRAAEAEARMKTSREEPRLAFERWVVSVCDRR